MTDPPVHDASRNARLDDILAAYLEFERSRQEIERQRLLAENAGIADELRAFFADQDRMKAVADRRRESDARNAVPATGKAALIASGEVSFTAAGRGWCWCRRHPAIAALTAGIAASLVIGTLVSWSFAVQADKQAREARRNEALAVSEKQRADDQARIAMESAARNKLEADKSLFHSAMSLDARHRADLKAAEVRRKLYAAHMNLAQAAWEDGRVSRVLELLKQDEPQPGNKEDLRGFEWHYWNRLAHSFPMSPEGHQSLVSVVLSVAFRPDGMRLASAGWDGTVKVWDATSIQEALTLKWHTSAITCVAISPDGKSLASASNARDPSRNEDHTLKVRDTRSGQEKFTLRWSTDAGPVTSVAFSPDGKRLVSANGDQLKVWDAVSGQETLTWKGHTYPLNATGKSTQSHPVTCVAFSPDGKRLASASFDQTVKAWDATSGQEILTLKGHTRGVVSVTFSPDGKRLATSAEDGMLKVWDATSGQESLSWKAPTDGVGSVAFSPDEKWLASTSYGGTIKLWDSTTGQESLTLKGHTAAVMSVAFSPDGKRLASASSDQTVKLWDVVSGQETLTLKGHAAAVSCVAFSADGNLLVSASHDQTVKVWDATAQDKKKGTK